MGADRAMTTHAFWLPNIRPRRTIPVMPIDEEIKLFKSRRRWRVYGIALSVIFFSLAAIALCVAKEVANETRPLIIGEPHVEIFRANVEPVDSRIRL